MDGVGLIWKISGLIKAILFLAELFGLLVSEQSVLIKYSIIYIFWFTPLI
jgi:hypothetical protein